MKAKLIDGFMYMLPETETERIDLIKWQENVLENYDNLADWLFWIETKEDEDSVF